MNIHIDLEKSMWNQKSVFETLIDYNVSEGNPYITLGEVDNMVQRKQKLNPMITNFKNEFENLTAQPSLFDKTGKIDITARKKAITKRMKQSDTGKDIWIFRMGKE